MADHKYFYVVYDTYPERANILFEGEVEQVAAQSMAGMEVAILTKCRKIDGQYKVVEVLGTKGWGIKC